LFEPLEALPEPEEHRGEEDEGEGADEPEADAHPLVPRDEEEAERGEREDVEDEREDRERRGRHPRGERAEERRLGRERLAVVLALARVADLGLGAREGLPDLGIAGREAHGPLEPDDGASELAELGVAEGAIVGDVGVLDPGARELVVGDEGLGAFAAGGELRGACVDGAERIVGERDARHEEREEGEEADHARPPFASASSRSRMAVMRSMARSISSACVLSAANRAKSSPSSSSMVRVTSSFGAPTAASFCAISACVSPRVLSPRSSSSAAWIDEARAA